MHKRTYEKAFVKDECNKRKWADGEISRIIKEEQHPVKIAREFIGLLLGSGEVCGSFGWAIGALKAGAKVARAGWNGKGMYLVLVEPTCDMATDSVHIFKDIAKPFEVAGDFKDNDYIPTDGYIVMRTAQKTAQPGWLASQADMLSDDWMVV